MRRELADAAFDLVIRDGFDQTADELAGSLGISRATFFRHFGSKEEVVITAVLGPDTEFADAYAAARHDASASLWQRLRSAFEPAIAMADSSPDRMRARIRLIGSMPALVARLRRARAPQVERLAALLASDTGQTVFAARVLAAAAVVTLDTCWGEWARSDDGALRPIVDAAFTHLHAAALSPG